MKRGSVGYVGRAPRKDRTLLKMSELDPNYHEPVNETLTGDHSPPSVTSNHPPEPLTGSVGYVGRAPKKDRTLLKMSELDPNYHEPVNETLTGDHSPSVTSNHPPEPLTTEAHSTSSFSTLSSPDEVKTCLTGTVEEGSTAGASTTPTTGTEETEEETKGDDATASGGVDSAISTPDDEDCTMSTPVAEEMEEETKGDDATASGGVDSAISTKNRVSDEKGHASSNEGRLRLQVQVAPPLPVSRQVTLLKHVRVLVTFDVISKVTENHARLQQEISGFAVSGGRGFISFNDNTYASKGKILRPFNFIDFKDDFELTGSINHFVTKAFSKDLKSFSIVLYRRFVEQVLIPLRSSGELFFFGIGISNFKIVQRNMIGCNDINYEPNYLYINENTGGVEQEVIVTLDANTIHNLVHFLIYLARKISLYKRDVGIPQTTWNFFQKIKDLPYIRRNTLPLNLAPQPQDIK